MILRTRTLKVGLSLMFMLSLWSCGSDKKSEDTSPCAAADAIVADATYDSLWTNVFSARCGTCHGANATGTDGGPDLRTKALFHENMVNKSIADYPAWLTAKTNQGSCLTTPLIKEGSAAGSMIVGTLDATAFTVADCEPKPHKEAPQSICISNGSLAALKKWIDNGASK